MAVRLEEGARSPNQQANAVKNARVNQQQWTAARELANQVAAAGMAKPSAYNAWREVRHPTPVRPQAGAPVRPKPTSSSASRGRSYGGGGGGGGGGADAAAAEEKASGLRQIANLLQLMNGSLMQPATQDANRQRLSSATADDQATLTASFDGLDNWLKANNSNAYANAPRAAYTAPDAGVSALLADQGGNPNSLGAEAAVSQQRGSQTADVFNNLLQVLAATQTASQQSRGAESQQARTFATNELTAGDNAMRAYLDMQEQKAREAANQQKLQMAAQLMQLAAQYGFDAPTNAQMGIA